MPSQANVLLVDDDERVLRSLGNHLKFRGRETLCAGSAAQALEMLSDHRLDVVVTDICMPGMDGVELVREAGRLRPDVGCIVMTGHPDKYRYIDIINAGAKDFLRKPFELEELEAKIERVLLDQEMTARLTLANRELARQAGVNAALSELCRGLMVSMPLEEMTLRVLKSAKRLTRSPGGCLAVIDPEAETLELVHGDIAGAACSGEGLAPDADGPGAQELTPCDWRWIGESGRAHRDNNLGPGSQCRHLPGGALAAARLLAAPAMDGPRLLGIVAVADAPTDYDETDERALEDVAAVYAMAIRRRRDEVALEKANAKLETLLDVVSNKFSCAERLLRRSMEVVQELGRD